MKDFNQQTELQGPEWEFYKHDQKASVYVLVFPGIGFYVGFTKKRYNDGFHGCISTYYGSGNTISHLKSQGVQPKRYILASGTAHEMKLLEDRILANTIKRNGSLNITLGTLNAMEAIQDGVDLCDGAKVRLKKIVRHFQEIEENKLFFDAKRVKLRENTSLRSELLQLATLEACHAG